MNLIKLRFVAHQTMGQKIKRNYSLEYLPNISLGTCKFSIIFRRPPSGLDTLIKQKMKKITVIRRSTTGHSSFSRWSEFVTDLNSANLAIIALPEYDS